MLKTSYDSENEETNENKLSSEIKSINSWYIVIDIMCNSKFSRFLAGQFQSAIKNSTSFIGISGCNI